MRLFFFSIIFYLSVFFYSSFSYSHSVSATFPILDGCDSDHSGFPGHSTISHVMYSGSGPDSSSRITCVYYDASDQSPPTPPANAYPPPSGSGSGSGSGCPESGSESQVVLNITPDQYGGDFSSGGCNYSFGGRPQSAHPDLDGNGNNCVDNGDGTFACAFNVDSQGPTPSDSTLAEYDSPTDEDSPTFDITNTETTSDGRVSGFDNPAFDDYVTGTTSSTNSTSYNPETNETTSTETTTITGTTTGGSQSTTTNTTTSTTNNSTGVTVTNTEQTTIGPDGQEVVDYTETSTDYTPEEEEPKSSVSGGGACSSAPSCDGDAVQCAILLQQFHDRCNTDKSASNPLDCAAGFQCDGDAIQCAILRLDHDNYCSLQQYESISADTVFQDAGLTSVDDLETGSSWTDSNIEELSLQSDLTSLLTDIDSAGGNNTADCPQSTVVDFGGLGSVEVSYVGVCGLAETTRPFFIMLATFFAFSGLVNVFRGFS